MLQFENLNIVMNFTTLVGIGFSLRKISTAISTFTNRIENLEREHKEVTIVIAKMEHRHQTNENSINNIQISLARFEAKLDLLLKSK